MKRLLTLTLALLLVITLAGTVGVTRSLAEEENPYLGLWEITGQQNGDQYASLADAGRKAYMDFLPSGAIYGVMSADGQHIKSYMGYKVTGENTLDIYEGEEGIPAVYDPATGIITVTAEENFLTFVERVKEDPLPDIRALVDNADEERTYYGYKMTQDGQEIDMVTMLPAMGMDPEDFYLTLNPDGTGYVQFGSEDAGGEITWTDTTLTAEGESITYTREGDYLLLSIDGTTGVTFAPEGEVEALMAMNGIEIAERMCALAAEQLGIRDYLRTITCDAYAAYDTVAKESDGKISVSNCLSHARRRWVYALEVIHPGGYTDEQLKELPEVKALILIQEVFRKDTPLKKLSPQERQEKRDTEVRPTMKAYLDFVHSLNPEDLSLSEKARDAVSYTIHHEAGLTKFLDDGNIPPDNSFSERIVKAVALGRRNWLFAMTPDGARTICVFDTFVATARANHANVYYYLKYLIEKAPLIPQTGGEALLDDLMPWSETYRKYEQEQAAQDASLAIGGEDPPRPRTPRKKDKQRRA